MPPIAYKDFTIKKINARGFVKKEKQEILARDFDCHNIDVFCLQIIALRKDSKYDENAFVINAKWKNFICRHWTNN